MAHYKNLGYKKIFVALDGTEEQDAVLNRAIAVAKNNHAKLYVGHVMDSTALETAGTYPVDLIPKLEALFRKSIEKTIETIQNDPEIDGVEVVVKYGRVRETLKEELLDQIEPDLVICGARGLSPIKYALLGSISTFLLRATPCDILVVK
ncbi:universal stress protein [Atopobium fossor]|uniref:universal stress protein n=1 Tax=Atopobium fossor TaxID=39487 RepID=UPI0003F75DD6|nr:universal stress protein [Atopobium fossor]